MYFPSVLHEVTDSVPSCRRHRRCSAGSTWMPHTCSHRPHWSTRSLNQYLLYFFHRQIVTSTLLILVSDSSIIAWTLTLMNGLIWAASFSGVISERAYPTIFVPGLMRPSRNRALNLGKLNWFHSNQLLRYYQKLLRQLLFFKVVLINLPSMLHQISSS